MFSQTGRLDCIEATKTAFTVASIGIFERLLFILDSYDYYYTADETPSKKKNNRIILPICLYLQIFIFAKVR